ncbi:hypothetical protein [Piscinibacter sp. XHJ-5]|uniref:hypothetical protein n=1 Tax=Piscinibacter sp. XHJ-5 TaxID=3037797 RepID=UPI002452FF36|nr:hypothetical protein [Piscinibacter sp. XHJ-5]
MKAVAALLLACIALLLGCEKAPADVADRRAARAVVSDLEHRQVQIVIGAAELATFNSQWLAKRDTGKASADIPIEQFRYLIDVEAKVGGGRWLYSTDGWVVKLDHKAHTLYQLPKAEEFNRVLGVSRQGASNAA